MIRLGEYLEHQESEGQYTDEGLFGMGKPDPGVIREEIDNDLLLASIERNIQARRYNVQSLGACQRLADSATRNGDQKQARAYRRGVDDSQARLRAIDEELLRDCARYVAQHQPKVVAVKEGA